MIEKCKEIEIVSNILLPGGLIYELILKNPGWTYKPGQFMMLRPLDWKTDPLWGRPLSISEMNSVGIKFLYQVVGKGTRLLSNLEKGDKIAVWGPLGKGFGLETENICIMAGGIGVAPFIGLVKSFQNSMNIDMIFGCSFNVDFFPLGEIKNLVSIDASVQTDKLSLDIFIAKLEQKFKQLKDSSTKVLACGPTPFLRTVRKFALTYNVETQISLESKMACGIGVCLGCATKTNLGLMERVCIKGPVFNAKDVLGENL